MSQFLECVNPHKLHRKLNTTVCALAYCERATGLKPMGIIYTSANGWWRLKVRGKDGQTAYCLRSIEKKQALKLIKAIMYV